MSSNIAKTRIEEYRALHEGILRINDLRSSLFNVGITHASTFSKATIVDNYQELAILASKLTCTFMIRNA